MDNANATEESLNALRQAMGTSPELNVEDDSTIFYKGVEGVTAELFDAPLNPYRTIFEVTAATWGNEEYKTKWPLVSPENKFKVVMAALTGQALPQALECCLFTFIVRGASRSAFDQHARQRFATFYSIGTRDNSRMAAGFRIPTELVPGHGGDAQTFEEVVAHVNEYKRLYKKLLQQGHTFQTARILQPMGATHHYKFSASILALKSYISQRAKLCEQPDTVQTAISVWNGVNNRFPLIASVMRPGCDFVRRCQYHQEATLSELLSCLFAGCGRWPDPKPYSTFKTPCSNAEWLKNESGIRMPGPNEWVNYQTFDSLPQIDKNLFNA